MVVLDGGAHATVPPKQSSASAAHTTRRRAERCRDMMPDRGAAQWRNRNSDGGDRARLGVPNA